MLTHGVASRLNGVIGASPPLSLEYVWTEHTSKPSSKFFDDSN